MGPRSSLVSRNPRPEQKALHIARAAVARDTQQTECRVHFDIGQFSINPFGKSPTQANAGLCAVDSSAFRLRVFQFVQDVHGGFFLGFVDCFDFAFDFFAQFAQAQIHSFREACFVFIADRFRAILQTD